MRNLQKLPVLTIFCGSTGICTIVSARKNEHFYTFLYLSVTLAGGSKLFFSLLGSGLGIGADSS